MKRSEQLLLLIDERTTKAVGKDHDTDTMHWCPSADREYVSFQDTPLFIYGAGDMSALMSLERRGFIVHIRETNGWAITEEGRLFAQDLA